MARRHDGVPFGLTSPATRRRPIWIAVILIALGACSSTAEGYPDSNGRDLDCSDIGHPIRVTGADPHGLDRDGDGIGCESW